VKALVLLLVLAVGLGAPFGGHNATEHTRQVVSSVYVSPDRKWSLAYGRKHGYGHLDVTERATGRVFRMYSSNDGCCAQITWLRPHLLIFVDDYHTKTLAPATRRVATIAHFSNFVVSPDGRWVAGWADCGTHCQESVDVVRITGGQCRTVPRRPAQDDNALRFSRDGRTLTIRRRFFDVRNGAPMQDGFPSRWHVVTVPLATLRPVADCSGR
jgi:hypothetical protein